MPEGELTPYQVHGMQPVLGVRDMQQTLAYYRDQLGFHVDFVAGEPPAHARICSTPTYQQGTVFIRFEPLAPGEEPSPSVWLWLHVGSDLDRLYELYVARGVKAVQSPLDRPWGLRQFTIEDCNGYLISFSEEL